MSDTPAVAGHVMLHKMHTHNGATRAWWECSAGDWHQHAREPYTGTTINSRVALIRFNAHLQLLFAR